MTASSISNCDNVSVTDSTFHITTTVNPNTEPLEELRKLADWFTPINFRSTQIDKFDMRTPGTGTWFIENSKFQKWLSMDTGVLCGEGMPGAGKTILSSIVIDHLQTHFSSHQSTAIVFAYCRHTDRYSLRDFLASFVKQLVEDHPSIFPTIKSVYNDHQKKATRPSRQQLQELVQKLFGLFNKVYIVIDALDEVPDDTRIEILTTLSTYRASLMVTSRSIQHVDRLPSAVHIRIDHENRNDIKFFLEERIEGTNLKNLLRGREELRQEILTKLLQESEGMFLVAALQIERLKGSISVAKLRTAAASLPSRLNDLYGCTWGRIKEQTEDRVSLATKAITWLVYAYRSLTIEELQHALAVSDETERFDEDDIAAEELLVSVCCGLMVVDGQSRLVHLVHYTAFDFFREHSSDLCSKPHTFLTTSCLAYLSTFDFFREMQLGEALHGFLEKGFLLHYAYHNWGFHAKACCREGGLPRAVSTFVGQCNRYPNPDFHSDLFKPCHVAAYYGLADILPMITECCNELTIHRYTPLMLSSANGHEAFVKLILSQNDIAINTANYYGRTALILASCDNREATVELLLSRNDLNINTQDAWGQTALISASGGGHAATVKLLLSRTDIDINTQDSSGQSALILASGGGHEAIVSLLLSRNDIDINTQDSWGETAFTSAYRRINTQDSWGETVLISAESGGGHEAIVKLLLSRDDINIKDTGGRTALIYFSCDGHEAIVKLLLSRTDIDINTQDSDGKTALISAAHHGHETTVKLLLSEEEININTQDCCGQTALIFASGGGHTAIVELLLSRNDININTQDSDGKTALISAAHHGRETTAKLLLSEEEININTQDSCGQTALIFASGGGHAAIVELVLSRNDIDINIQDSDGNTALISAAHHGHETTVKLLLSEEGININIQDSCGRTALIFAADGGHAAIVELLLSRNDIDINTQDSVGKTALISAACHGHAAVVKLLLSRNDVDIYAQESLGQTALISASGGGHEAVVNLLLSQNNIDINTQDSDGETALISASHEGHGTVVQLLLSQCGIDINTQNSLGQTALILASAHGYDVIVISLLSRNDIDLFAQDSLGQTALDYALYADYEAVVNLLLSQDNININAQDS